MHFFPKLDENGDIKRLKMGRRQDGKDYAEERKTLETYYEYYVENPEEIVEFINVFSLNAETFDYKTYLEDVEEPAIVESN